MKKCPIKQYGERLTVNSELQNGELRTVNGEQ